MSSSMVSYFFSNENGYLTERYYNDSIICESMFFVPGQNYWNKGTITFLFGLFLIYLFLGIAIVADKFMAAIEVITSEEKTITQKNENGEDVEIALQVWNPTVANLTLMALGSSAPEILLSVIETVQTLGSEPGELGPAW